MSNKTIEILRRPYGKPDHFLIVEVTYDKGGPGVFCEKVYKRGYSLRSDVHIIQKHEHGESRGYTLCSPHYHTWFLEETTRFSRKRLEQLAASFEGSVYQEQIEKLYVSPWETKSCGLPS